MSEVAALLAQIRDELRIANALRSPDPGLYLTVRFWSMMASLMTLTLSLVLLLGHPRRLSSTAYWGLNSFGGARLWGYAFFVVAVLALIAVWQAPKLLRWAVFLQAIPYGLLAAAFLVSAIRFPDANLTAAPVYGWIAVMHICLSDFARRALRKGTLR